MGTDALTDPISNAAKTIEIVHALVHEGKTFTFSDQQTVNASASVSYSITVPAGTYPHIGFSLITDQATTMVLTEGATFTGGSDGLVYNRNRASSRTNKTTIKYGVTPSGGTVIWSVRIGASMLAASDLASGLEWILKPNASTQYVITLTNNGASTGHTSLELTFYEIS